MDVLTAAAASGMRARLESLELLANNMANAGSGGYKTDRESYGVYLAPEAATESFPAVLPVAERSWTDFSQGPLRATGNPLDLSLSGEGFFAVNGPSGPLYTRDGSFHTTPGGKIVNGENYALRGAGGAALQVDPSRPIEITPDGTVRQSGQAVGQIETVKFSNPAALEKAGQTCFRNTDANQKPAPAGATVEQGKLEGSNLDAPSAAVRLIEVMRQFEMLQRAATMGAEMNRAAIEQVARL